MAQYLFVKFGAPYLRSLSDSILKLIYPSSCEQCDCRLNSGWSICASCRDAFPEVRQPMCSVCGRCYEGAISSEFDCPNCRQRKLAFDFARAAYQGSEETLSLVHQFKYQRQIHLSKELGRLTSIALTDSRFSPYLEHGILIPVPLHWRRYRKRSFNQAEEIARSLTALRNDLTMLNALRRIRYTETQTDFSRAKRLQNLKGAFEVNTKYLQRIKQRPLILLDDVFTTGATANECAKTLRQAGASSVAILTLVRS